MRLQNDESTHLPFFGIAMTLPAIAHVCHLLVTRQTHRMDVPEMLAFPHPYPVHGKSKASAHRYRCPTDLKVLMYWQPFEDSSEMERDGSSVYSGGMCIKGVLPSKTSNEDRELGISRH